MKYFLWSVFGAVVLGLVACTTPHTPANVSTAVNPPFFEMALLPPVAWRQNQAVNQLLTIESRGQTHHVQALLEMSDEAVHLVVLKYGQRMVTVLHDAMRTQVSSSPYVPDFLKAQRVVMDLQIAYADINALNEALQHSQTMAHCVVTDAETQREVSCANQVVYQIQYAPAPSMRLRQPTLLRHVLDGYDIRIQPAS